VANPKNLIGKGFDKNPNNINRKGRPKRLVSGLIVELKNKGYEKVTTNQINELIELIIGLDRDEIIRLGTDTEQPMYVRIVARKLASTNDKDLFETIEKLLDRGHGKPTQKTELSGADGGAIIWQEQKTYEANEKTNNCN